MHRTTLGSALMMGVLASLSATVQADDPRQDLFPADMQDTLGFYPDSFTDTDSGCRCVYIVKNTTNATLTQFRAMIYVHNAQGEFGCDIGVTSDKVEPGEIQPLSNLAVGQKCGQVTSVEYVTATRCEFDGRNACNEEQFRLVPHAGVEWQRD